jgi:superfamily II DNA or RNA helicase
MSEQQNPIVLRLQDSVTYVEGRMDKTVYSGLKKILGFEDEKAVWKQRAIQQKFGNKAKWMKNFETYQTTVCYAGKCRCAVKKQGTHFPTGLASKAIEYFKDFNVPYQILNERSAIAKNAGYSMSDEFESRDYQQTIIADSCNRERGIIKVATGGGKTSIASGIISQIGAEPTVFYVTSKDLLRQAREELTRFIRYQGKPLEVGVVGGGKCELKDITVMTVQTAVKALGHRFAKYDDEDDSDSTKLNDQNKKQIVDFIKSSKLMVCDEVQHWAAKTCQIIADSSVSARYRFGLSATPWRDEGDDMLIDGCFGRAIADISASFLIERGYLVQPSIYFVHARKANLEGAYATVYKEGIVENQERNMMIANIAQKMTEAGRHVLVLIKIIDHGKQLEAMIPNSFFVNGSHSAKTRSEWIEKMRRREAPVTIATSIFDEGVDVKPLDGLILGGSGKSQTRALQRVGRVLRTYEDKMSGFVKKDAFVVDFQDNMKYMLGHSRKRRKIYETEPKFIIKDWK